LNLIITIWNIGIRVVADENIDILDIGYFDSSIFASKKGRVANFIKNFHVSNIISMMKKLNLIFKGRSFSLVSPFFSFNKGCFKFPSFLSHFIFNCQHGFAWQCLKDWVGRIVVIQWFLNISFPYQIQILQFSFPSIGCQYSSLNFKFNF
jgi:hypothetical protein